MFRKLIAYFLLFNFVNTICFYELPASVQPEESAAFVLEETTDEIDSITEFFAEVCLDLEDNFDDGDSDDIPDHLKKASAKQFLAANRFALLPAFATLAKPFCSYRFQISARTSDVPGIPPENIFS